MDKCISGTAIPRLFANTTEKLKPGLARIPRITQCKCLRQPVENILRLPKIRIEWSFAEKLCKLLQFAQGLRFERIGCPALHCLVQTLAQSKLHRIIERGPAAEALWMSRPTCAKSIVASLRERRIALLSTNSEETRSMGGNGIDKSRRNPIRERLCS